MTADERHPSAENAATDPQASAGARSSVDSPSGAPVVGKPRALRRLLVSVGVLALVLALVAGGGLWFLTNRYAGNVHRVADVFAGLDEKTRPAAPSPVQQNLADPVTFLLVGSDTRGHTANGKDPDGRSDAIMIARFSGDRRHAQVISIPRDSWVDIPGHGMNKINAAYAFGGPSLLIQTVEQVTKVRIDHYMAIDFDGIIQVTDDLGGVDVVVAETTTNGHYTFPAGVNHLTGTDVRYYLGQRKNLPGGDFDRVKRQQQYLKAMFSKLFSSATFTDPGRLDAALLIVTNAVSIDDGIGNTELLKLAYDMRNVSPGGIDFLTAPILGTGREGAASVVYLDTVTGERMWSYLRTDSLSANTREFGKEQLPDVPN
jgi:LCP family protein required for cell wall assembly